MSPTYSQKAKNWDGFRPIAYSISPKALDLPLRKFVQHGNEWHESEISVLGLLKEYSDRPFEIEDNITAIGITTSTESIGIQGPSFNRRFALHLLEFMKEGIPEFETRWFFYDRDSCRHDPMTSYKFFVVAKDRIIREYVSFTDCHDSGFDPSVFDSGDEATSIWFNDSRWEAAFAAFWYRRFYKETRNGQLMVLRPDDPPLYHYPEGRSWKSATISESQLASLRTIKFLCWVSVAIQALIAIHLIRP